MLIVAPMQLTIAWQEPIENGAYIDAYKVRFLTVVKHGMFTAARVCV